ncbi:hypothetical protein BSPWISOXPB_1240 [uncultured Gammaproteobacteria bacterium]|nr:hypothetical protein BSPWISOXPB_1240 [uncultured Gammaproteobacteria bacterium]
MFESLADWLVFDLLEMPMQGHLSDTLHFFVMDIVKIFFMLALIIYFMGLLRFYISPEKYAIIYKEIKILCTVNGNCLRWRYAILLLLFHSIVFRFLRAGIPLSVVFTFLIASPMINEIAVIILIGVVGWKATLMFVAAGAIIAFFGGILMEKMGVEKYI